jgi:hypothetical protein
MFGSSKVQARIHVDVRLVSPSGDGILVVRKTSIEDIVLLFSVALLPFKSLLFVAPESLSRG